MLTLLYCIIALLVGYALGFLTVSLVAINPPASPELTDEELAEYAEYVTLKKSEDR